jgi:hypothetical protein
VTSGAEGSEVKITTRDLRVESQWKTPRHGRAEYIGLRRRRHKGRCQITRDEMGTSTKDTRPPQKNDHNWLAYSGYAEPEKTEKPHTAGGQGTDRVHCIILAGERGGRRCPFDVARAPGEDKRKIAIHRRQTVACGLGRGSCSTRGGDDGGPIQRPRIGRVPEGRLGI